MVFRTSDILKRNQMTRFQLDEVIRSPANGQAQSNNGYKFSINYRTSFFDWYNACFEVQFQLQKLADGTTYGAERATGINGSHSLINQMTIKSGGIIIYDIYHYSNDIRFC